MRMGATWGQGTFLVPKQAGADEPPQERGKGRSGQGREARCVWPMAGLECVPDGRGTF